LYIVFFFFACSFYIVLQLLKKKMKKLEEDFEKLDHSKIETLVADDGNLTDTVN
jgi:hypothetical protein